MKNIDKDLIKWITNKIEKEYKNDVSLLLGRKGACKVPGDGEEVAFDFFIPATDRGYGLARTFIIDDMGYDLFPMSWERVEGLAALNEGIIFCLADSEILYARNEADRERFEILRKTLYNNLKDKEYAYKKSLEKINFAMDIYKTMMFEKSLCSVRKAAGGIIEYLCEAIVIINGTYIKKDYGYAERLSQIKELKKVPRNFIENYEKIIGGKDIDEILQVTHNIIEETRDFFNGFKVEKVSKSYNFDELAGWYEESRYTFRRIEYACENNNVEGAFSWGCYLQIELDILTEEAGLKTMDLLGTFDDNDLSNFAKCSKEIEEYIVSEIKNHNVQLRKYSTLDEFLRDQQ